MQAGVLIAQTDSVSSRKDLQEVVVTATLNEQFVNKVPVPVTGKFIVLKTATGKYAKLEVTSYYKDAPAAPTATSVSRFYHFRFVLQANGTRNFK